MSWQIRQGDALSRLRELPAESVQTVVTSPPYWGLRDYGCEGQLGLEPTPDQYVANLVSVFAEVRRVLRDDGTVWLNLGDSYAGSWGAQSRPNGSEIGRTLEGGSMLSARQIEAHPRGTHTGSLKNTPGLKPKDLCGIPWRVAFALQADGWWLRSDIIWAKRNLMPESVRDRPTRSHEYIFLLTKSANYFYDADAVREQHAESTEARAGIPSGGNPTSNGNNHRLRNEPIVASGRNKRSVWTVATTPFPGAHFAVFPPKLIEPCILAGSAEGDTVLDPFCGSGTTGVVALRHDRSFVGIELNPEYVQMARHRICDDAPLLNTGLEVAA